MSLSILLAAQAYPPDIGGEERHVHSLAQGLALRGHRVTVVTQTLDGTESDSVERHGVRVLRLSSAVTKFKSVAIGSGTRPNAPPLPDPVLWWHLRPILDELHPDVIHAHNWIVYTMTALTMTRSIPVVFTLHNQGYVCGTHRYMYLDRDICSGPGLGKCLRCSSHHYGPQRGIPVALTLRPSRRLFLDSRLAYVMAVSKSVAALAGLSKGSVPWSVVPNFIPDTLVTEKPDRQETGSSQPIVYVGDIHRDKGVDVLLDAYERLDRRIRPPLVCMGRYHLDPSLVLPDGVTILPPGPHEAAMALIRTSRFVVLPSVCPDACPTAVLEAMAAGKAVVASASGGVVDLVAAGETGYLVPPGDPVALHHALTEAASNRRIVDAMGLTGQRRVRQFCESTVIPRIEGIYEQVLRPYEHARVVPQSRE